jgi:hypothetical protein
MESMTIPKRTTSLQIRAILLSRVPNFRALINPHDRVFVARWCDSSLYLYQLLYDRVRLTMTDATIAQEFCTRARLS